MGRRTIETDYLVVGAGASGMAFTDSLIAASDAEVVLVDRRHAPAGHWNDAYPFVRLHQPAAYYGVNSLPLGRETIDRHGPNAGFYAQASAPEICAHFERAMNERLLASGRVRYFPVCEYVADCSFASRLSGDEYEVKVRRKVVDARYLEPSIPLTYEPPFDVSADARCVPPNDLPRLAQRAPTATSSSAPAKRRSTFACGSWVAVWRRDGSAAGGTGRHTASKADSQDARANALDLTMEHFALGAGAAGAYGRSHAGSGPSANETLAFPSCHPVVRLRQQHPFHAHGRRGLPLRAGRVLRLQWRSLLQCRRPMSRQRLSARRRGDRQFLGRRLFGGEQFVGSEQFLGGGEFVGVGQLVGSRRFLRRRRILRQQWIFGQQRFLGSRKLVERGRRGARRVRAGRDDRARQRCGGLPERQRLQEGAALRVEDHVLRADVPSAAVGVRRRSVRRRAWGSLQRIVHRAVQRIPGVLVAGRCGDVDLRVGRRRALERS